jgi:hypothetical protein
VIRNAGGRATDDAIRSLVISTKLLGTREWFVIHHTNCGMETFTDQVMGDLLAKSLDTAELGEAGWRDVGKGPGSPQPSSPISNASRADGTRNPAISRHRPGQATRPRQHAVCCYRAQRGVPMIHADRGRHRRHTASGPHADARRR